MKLTAEMVREYFGASGTPSTKSIFVLDAITPKVRAIHDKSYPTVVAGLPLLALNRGRHMGYIPFTGFLLTNEAIGFKTIKDRWLSSFTLSKQESTVMPLGDVRSIQIGKHDHCAGSAYVGHQLIINGDVRGLVRMGGTLFDSKAIAAVNGFAQWLFDRGVADTAPKAFLVQ